MFEFLGNPSRKSPPGGNSNEFATTQPQQQQQPKSAQQRCDEILAELTSLETEVDGFGGVKNDKLFLKIDELITRSLLKLDEIDRGDEQVNQTRKKLINFAHKLSDRLDEIATRNATAVVLVGSENGEPDPKRPKSPKSSSSSPQNAAIAAAIASAASTLAAANEATTSSSSPKSTQPPPSISNLINQFETPAGNNTNNSNNTNKKSSSSPSPKQSTS